MTQHTEDNVHTVNVNKIEDMKDFSYLGIVPNRVGRI